MIERFQLDIDKIEKNIIPQFSLLFSNPREMKLFKNFIKSQAYIKNKFLGLLYEKENYSKNIDLLKEKMEIIWTENIEGQFVYLYYSIFILPNKTSDIFLSPESFFSLISDGNFEESINFPNNKIKDINKSPKNYFDEFFEGKNSYIKKLMVIRDKFRNYHPKNSFIINLLLQNNIQSLIDISKVDSIFLGKGNYKAFEDLVKEEFKDDWNYLFIILKKKILSELHRNYDFYKYFSLFVEGSFWKEGDIRTHLENVQLEKILSFFNEMIQFPKFLDLICETIVFHVSPKTDFILHDNFKTFGNFNIYSEKEGIFGEKSYKNEEIFINIINTILKHIFNQILPNEDKDQLNSEFIYRISFYLNSILRMFPIQNHDIEMAFSDQKIRKALVYGGLIAQFENSQQKNLVNYSYNLLNFKIKLNKLKESKDLNYKFPINLDYKFPTEYISFEDEEIFGTIINLLRRNAEPKGVPRKVVIESIETLLFMLYVKRITKITKNKNRLEKILEQIRKELNSMNLPSEFDKLIYSDYLFIGPNWDEEIINLTLKVSISKK